MLLLPFLGVTGFCLLICRFSPSGNKNTFSNEKISCVIACRNEEHNIGSLLDDVKLQTHSWHEVIVVDDRSTDRTRLIALERGARVISIDKEEVHDSMPKAYAQHQGALHAAGTVLVFLDADVRLQSNFLERIIARLGDNDCVSVQPFHVCRTFRECMSLFFHVVSIVSSGIFSLVPFRCGIYGPCIVIRRKMYDETGGFGSPAVRKSIVEDVTLDEQLRIHGARVERFVGAGATYSMYDGLADAARGWHKNIAQGASRVPLVCLAVMVLYLGALIWLPIEIVRNTSGYPILAIALFLFAWMSLLLVARKLGTYTLPVCVYPLALVFFFLIFTWSAYAMIFNRPVTWKDQKIVRS